MLLDHGIDESCALWIEEMKADAFSAAGEFAQFAREMQPDKKPRGHVVRVNGMRHLEDQRVSSNDCFSTRI